MNRTPPDSISNPNERQPGACTEFSPRSVTDSTPLLWLTVLSLDAPAVAALWQLLFARSFHAPLSASVTVLLALVVWLIYVADRVLDAMKAPAQSPEANRHIFYRRHLWAFLLPLYAGSMVAAWMSLTRLDVRTFGDGVIILFAVGVYLLLVHLVSPRRRWLPKEMLVGILFALGTCFPVWEKMTESSSMLVVQCVVFAALCWMNCAAIEYAEWSRLRGRRFGSPHRWTEWMGRHFVPLSFAVAAVPLGLMVSGLGRLHWQILAAELFSSLSFAAIRSKEKSLSIDQFRVLVDVALFTPIVFLLH